MQLVSVVLPPEPEFPPLPPEPGMLTELPQEPPTPLRPQPTAVVATTPMKLANHVTRSLRFMLILLSVGKYF